jgi:hypothetical protein
MIESYSIETKVPPGNWLPFPHIDVRNGILYEGFDLKNLFQVDISNSFYFIAQNKNIAPRETISGWLYLVVPKTGYTDFLRFHLIDTTGTEYIEPIDLDPTNKTAFNNPVQKIEIRQLIPPQKRDASQLPAVLYGD